MRTLARFLAVILLALAPALARAQSTLLQGGNWTAGHAPMYATTGVGAGSQTVVQDSGPASGGAVGLGLSELLVTARGTGTAPYAGQGTGPYGTTACNFDAPTTNATGYHYFCWSPNAQGGALIAVGAGGAASSLPLSFIVNGTTYAFPFVSGGIVGPGTTVVGDAACWNNLVGTLLADCGAFVTVGGNNTWTGTNNFTSTFKIAGVTQAFPASGNLVGTSDTQNLTNKSIGASQINSGTLSATVMPAYTGDVTSSAGATVNTIAAGVVTNAKLAVMTQNAVKGAATSTAVADLAVPSCVAAGNALQWTTNTGFSCGTLTNQSAGWGLTGSSTFSISTTAPPYAFDFPINMGLSASVSASALTINLTTADGSTPSATKPVLVPFRSTTVATGTTVWTAITSALSIVIPSAATLGTASSNVPFRIWIFLEYNAGVPELVVATCSINSASAATIYPCASWESSVTTTTTISGFATSAGTPYATTGVASDAIRIIGYGTYSAGLATAGAWASTPTSLHVMGPGHKKPGDEIQSLVSQSGALVTSANTYTVSDTPPTPSGGTTAVTQAITMTSTANILEVNGQTVLGSSTDANSFTAFLSQDAVTTPLVVAPVSTRNATTQLSTVGVATRYGPATVSAITLKLYATNSAGTLSINGFNGGRELGGLANTYIKVREIMGALPGPANDNIDPGVYSMTG